MSPLDDSLIGKQLDEYRIDRPLGQGGMARVYRALDTKLRRYVALKVIAPLFRAESDYASRFEREAQSIARLEHPNIVHVYRFGEADGLYYIAMQYIDGAALDSLIDDYKADGEVMPLAEIARVVADIGAALDYAHSKDVIHRDVKAANIIVNAQGQAVLTDFGLALLGDVGTQGEIFGSPHYIAPEQVVSSANAVPQSDLYALGVTLFEMLTGELPFGGDDPMEIARRHLDEPPPRPSQRNAAIPEAVDAVVLRCLEKEPFDRFQTGAELSGALQAACQAGPVEGHGAARRPSLVMLPHKVGSLLHQSAPPVALPEASPAPDSAPFVATPSQGPLMATRPALGQETVMHVDRAEWRAPLRFAGLVFLVGLIGLVIIFLGNQPPAGVALLPTETETGTATPSDTPEPPTLTGTPTDTPTEPPTLTFTPTTAPTNTPLVLPTLTPSATEAPSATHTPTALPTATSTPTTPPTATPVVISAAPPPTAVPVPPADRTFLPPGAHRLGEFRVESYCNDRGFGVILVNNQADWACTNPADGAVMFVLQPADFDSICRAWYGNPEAFALRDQQQEVQAYNWSCYVYLPVGAAATSLPPSLALPSAQTLQPRAGKDWIAFVNVSGVPLSLEYFELRRKERILPAAAWERSSLMPGECLRIYKKKNAPKDLPPNCQVAFDYPGSEKERNFWLEGEVTVVINPSTRYILKRDD